MLAKLAVATALAVAVSASAQADPAKARLIQKGVAAFECSIFVAFVSPSGEEESQRFFQIGYDSSMGFLEALNAGEVSEEEFGKFVRMDVALNLRRLGATHPAFSVGRFYQEVRGFAADRIMYGRTASGAIDFDNLLDDAESSAEAKRHYDKAGCVLIE